MSPITCPECDTKLRIPQALVEKLQGRKGKIRCKVCEIRLRVEGGESGIVVLGVLPPRADGEVSPSTMPAPPLSELSALAGHSAAPPFPGRESLAAPRVPSDDFGIMKGAAGLLSSTPAAPRRSPSTPPEDAPPQSEDTLQPVAFSAEEEFVAPSIAPSIPPTPPRPWELSSGSKLRTEQASISFQEDFGVHEVTQLTDVVHLSADGRLVNQADSSASAKKKRSNRAGVWFGGLAAAAALVVAFGASSPKSFAEGARMVGTALGQPSLLASGTAMTPSSALGKIAALHAERAQVEFLAEQEKNQIQVIHFPHELMAEAAPDTAAMAKAAIATKSSGAAPASATSNEAPADEAEEDALPAFDRSAVKLAINQATAAASACRNPADPTGRARVTVIFSPSGRVTSANLVGAPFAGSRVGSCIVSRFRQMRVSAFGGDYVTVSKTVEIN